DRAAARLPPRLAPAPRREGGWQLRPGVAWVAAFLVYMALLGGARGVLGGGAAIAPFAVVALALSTAIWWFTAWLMLKGQVRFRVLLPSGLIPGMPRSGFRCW